jgi:DNA replication factor GINS
MDLDYLRLIILEERDSGRLAEISYETFRDSAKYLQELYSEAKEKSIDNFSTRRVSELIDEIESVTSTLQDISSLRLNKIIKLALVTVQGGRTDKEELKRMLPPEREMYEEILKSVKSCRSRMIEPDMETLPAPVAVDETPVPVMESGESFTPDAGITPEDATAAADESHGYEPVYVSEDIDSFMGLDGRIYSLSKEDIVMLPEKNASVLYTRNIALNIRVGK